MVNTMAEATFPTSVCGDLHDSHLRVWKRSLPTELLLTHETFISYHMTPVLTLYLITNKIPSTHLVLNYLYDTLYSVRYVTPRTHHVLTLYFQGLLSAGV